MSQHIRPIRNPYAGNPDYNCFGCDPGNPIGLKLEFSLADQAVFTTWSPRNDLEGYPGVVHGGIQATIADELAAWYVYAVLGTAGVTKDMQLSYLKPALTSQGPFDIRATGVRDGERRAVVEVELRNNAGELCTTATCLYALFTEELARRRFGFPGRDAFVDPE